MSPPAFEAVFREHARYVMRALRYLGVREADLDDVTQEVFLVVHRRLPEFAGRSAIRTWVYGIAFRVAADHRKRAYNRREQPTDAPPDAGVAAHDEASHHRDTLRRLLDQLDDDRRAVVVLYEIEGFTMPEAARLLGIPVQTAYTRHKSARRQMEADAARLSALPSHPSGGTSERSAGGAA